MATSTVVLNFVNLGRQDAFIYAGDDADGSTFVARLASGGVSRQLTGAGNKWMIVTNNSYEVQSAATDGVILISERGIETVTETRALSATTTNQLKDTDFRGNIGDGAPEM